MLPKILLANIRSQVETAEDAYGGIVDSKDWDALEQEINRIEETLEAARATLRLWGNVTY